MIAKISGVLEAIDGASAMVATSGGLTYQVLLPAFVVNRLGGSIGQNVTLHTLYFMESQAQGATILPRLAGFLSTQDRSFYELFVTCKGIGHRRALRAMALASAQIAGAIADRDLATLQSLPEIGKRTAETIVVTLKGKIDAYLEPSAYVAAQQAAGAEPAMVGTTAGGGLARQALEVFTQLGENRAQAVQWIDQVLAQDEAPDNVEDVIAEVYRVKAGG